MNKKADDKCDVLIIGAGPAGSSAALKAAQGGAKVILIEQKKEIGAPVQCAEHIPVQLTTNIGLRDDLLDLKDLSFNLKIITIREFLELK